MAWVRLYSVLSSLKLAQPNLMHIHSESLHALLRRKRKSTKKTKICFAWRAKGYTGSQLVKRNSDVSSIRRVCGLHH
ncbi:hypothetical protein DFH06DRAFT_1185985 [Mycena polygramma]|nr:hypothetical protein DFH06DRAFT_1185985 [Mycena polygramma]